MKSKKTKLIQTSLLLSVLPFALQGAIPIVDLETDDAGYLDFRHLSATTAIGHLAHAMQLSYPLTEWKGIDWEAAYAAILPEIQQAVNENDNAAWFRAVRQFALTAQDGHVSVLSPSLGAFPLEPSDQTDAFGTDFGFMLLPTAKGEHVILVQPGGAAAAVGVQSGAVVESIEGRPAGEYVASQAVEWLNMGIATGEATDYFRGIAAGYAASGKNLAIRLIAPDTTEVQSLTIEGRPFEGVAFPGYERAFEDEALIEADMLTEGIGYVRIRALISQALMNNLTEATYWAFINEATATVGQTLETLTEYGAGALVLDLRGNTGGIDALGARIASFFVEQPEVYSHLLPFIEEIPGWDFQYRETEYVTPHANRFAGRVVVLVDQHTISAGERLAQVIGTLPQSRIVGFRGTYGSYAETGGLAFMPNDVIVTWPIAPHVDDAGQVLVDAAGDGVARVAPDIRIPHTAANLTAWYRGDPIEVQWAQQVLEDPLFGYFPGTYAIDEAWSWHPLLGWLANGNVPWCFHPSLGWIFLQGRGGQSQTFYSTRFGWCQSKTASLPHIYSASHGWLYVQADALWSYRDNNWIQ